MWVIGGASLIQKDFLSICLAAKPIEASGWNFYEIYFVYVIG